jgi:catechol 2,3-dioxygenase-like lactoylglutathione lyase family enzyme
MLSHTPAASLRRIDHLVLAARDLDAQADFYERLGFIVGQRNRHPWGTENRIVQMPGAFLELITIGADLDFAKGAPAFGEAIQSFLAQGEGMSHLVLSGDDARADVATFRRAGIDHGAAFDFGRKGLNAEGKEVEVAFSLAFARAAVMPALGFFTCQQHFPENFWAPARQGHTNRVTAIAEVTILSQRANDAASFLARFAGGEPIAFPGGATLATAAGAITVRDATTFALVFGDDPIAFFDGRPRFAAVTFHSRDLAATAERLTENGVPHRMQGGRIVVPSEAAFGVLIAFEATR